MSLARANLLKAPTFSHMVSDSKQAKKILLHIMSDRILTKKLGFLPPVSLSPIFYLQVAKEISKTVILDNQLKILDWNWNIIAPLRISNPKNLIRFDNFCAPTFFFREVTALFSFSVTCVWHLRTIFFSPIAKARWFVCCLPACPPALLSTAVWPLSHFSPQLGTLLLVGAS